MKSLYESILSGFDEIETDFVKKYSVEKYLGEWLGFILNVKSQNEFENYCKELKKTLDNYLGKNYDNAVAQAKKVRRGQYICIAHKKDVSSMEWVIYVNYGSSMISIFWDQHSGKTNIHKLLHHIHDYVDIHSKGYGNGKNRFYTYVCDTTCNDIFRVPLINKYKSIK